MEIEVLGNGYKEFKPDQVNFSFEFSYKNDSYEEVLNNGINNINIFINTILIPNGFVKEDLKTRSFIIRENKVYNESTRKYDFAGYIYTQKAYLVFDYDKEKMAKMMNEISKMVNAPYYNINFGIKDEKNARKELLAVAYNDAKEKAEAIAIAAGKTITRCLKTSFNPINGVYTSMTEFDSEGIRFGAAKMSAEEAIINTFTPEDIKITEKLYCIFICE